MHNCKQKSYKTKYVLNLILIYFFILFQFDAIADTSNTSNDSGVLSAAAVFAALSAPSDCWLKILEFISILTIVRTKRLEK